MATILNAAAANQPIHLIVSPEGPEELFLCEKQVLSTAQSI